MKLVHSLAGLLLLSAVSAAPALAEPKFSGIAAFKPYAARQIEIARAGAEQLVARIEDEDREKAKQAWILARDGWERSETITGGFFDAFDKKIDAWPNAKSGFHAIEVRLFGNADLKEILPLAKELAGNLKGVERQMRSTRITAQGLYNGVAQLAYEVGESKSKGNESRASNTSLNDMRNNLEGLTRAYDTVFAAALRAKNPAMDADIRKQIATLSSLLAVDEIGKLDQPKVEKAGEGIALTLVDAAPVLGLKPPKLEEEGEGEGEAKK